MKRSVFGARQGKRSVFGARQGKRSVFGARQGKRSVFGAHQGMRALVLLALGAVGCGHVEAHTAMLRSAEAPTSRPAELYLADQTPPSRPYYEIALVQVVGFGTDANPERVARALSEKAQGLGCDAVVRVYIDVGYSRAHAAGVCAKYLGSGAAGPPPVLPSPPGPNPRPADTRPAPAPRVEPLPSAPQGR